MLILMLWLTTKLYDCYIFKRRESFLNLSFVEVISFCLSYPPNHFNIHIIVLVAMNNESNNYISFTCCMSGEPSYLNDISFQNNIYQFIKNLTTRIIPKLTLNHPTYHFYWKSTPSKLPLSYTKVYLSTST